MGASATAGFIFKLIANAQANKAEQQKYLLQAHTQAEDSRDSANARGGIWMKRFTVFVMISLFAVISLGYSGDTTNLVETIKGDSYLWGLIQFADTTVVTPVKGMVLDDTLRTSVLSIISFLFGADVGDKK